MQRSRVGGIAAMLSAALFVVIVLFTVGITFTTDGNSDNDGAALYVLWITLIAVAVIAAAVAVHGALEATGGFDTAMAKFAFGLAALAVPATLFAWLWFGWGGLLAVSFLLLALHLRTMGFGIAGHRSFWDWAMPVAYLIGPASMFALSATVAGEDDEIDWAYTTGFSISTLLAAATLFTLGRWLRADVAVLQEARSA